MSDGEITIAIIAVIGGIGFAIFLFWGIFNLIQQWINRKSGTSNSDINPQFFKALGEFKKNTERRITNLESIVADLEEERYTLNETGEKGDISIEEKNERNSDEKGESGNLRNMLNE